MKVRYVSFIVILILSATLSAQSLFETETGKDKEKSYELNGYLRSTLFVGKVPDGDQAEIKSAYGEASLKFRVRKQDWGDAFAEIRFRKGSEFNEPVSELNLREVYVNAYIGAFDFRIGHQIVAWGRADSLNPTDNITPKNMLVRSPDEDDRRQGNFLLRAHYNLRPIRFEAIWVPFFKSSVIPTNLLAFPPSINIIEPDYPDERLINSAFALRVNLELASLDGSLSYFNGHNPFPGISGNIPNDFTDDLSIDIFPKSYRMHVLGADFQTTVAGLGLRGEIGYRRPHGDYENVHIPHPDLQCVVGIDREFSGDFNLIVQYIGRYVFDYTELIKPTDLSLIPFYQLELKNRMVAFQQYEWSHSISSRAEWKFLYETLKFEILSFLNVTSEEFFFRPKATYDIADGFTFTMGGELYLGPKDTLFGTIDSHLNSVFLELKAFF